MWWNKYWTSDSQIGMMGVMEIQMHAIFTREGIHTERLRTQRMGFNDGLELRLQIGQAIRRGYEND